MSEIFENLVGKLLVAVPSISDKRFQKSVILMCGHDKNGAIGLVLNKPLFRITFKTLLRQLAIDDSKIFEDIKIYEGGGVEVGRGFILHSSDFYHNTTVKITPDIYLTATTDILKAISQGQGPEKFKVCLGYAGWGAGQLELEMQTNSWIQANSSIDLIFSKTTDLMWEKVVMRLGITYSSLASELGHG